MSLHPGQGETLDRLAGDWWIFQLRRGHRYATDDVLTAWTAVRARPGARRVLDLGAGVGSIGLMVLGCLDKEAHLTSVEVLDESVSLARRTVTYNGLEARVDVRRGDLRDPTVIAPSELFDVITANPPFLPEGTGWPSPQPQRRAARFELHGDVFDYCRVAARHLDDRGRLCFCHAAADKRPARAVNEAGLVVLTRQLVVFRCGRPPQLALYCCGLDDGSATEAGELDALCVRDEHGQRTDGYLQVLREMRIVE